MKSLDMESLYNKKIFDENTIISDNCVYFQQGVQRFKLFEGQGDCEKTINWARKMLAIALTNFAKDQIKS